MTRQEAARILKLSDTDLTLADPGEDITGRSVVDAGGEEIGTVDDLMIDDTEKRVRFIRVASGGFLGLGQQKYLIPIDAVKRLTRERVYVDRDRDQIAAAPTYDPDLVEEDYFDRLYGYYGYAPYWTAGYVYPGFRYPY
jgi:sporulation protein YlmC with PRC-barrel domain